MFRIGFDIGGTNIACALIDESAEILKKLDRPFVAGSTETLADTLYSMAVELVDNASCSALESVSHVGVCVPGSIDISRGVVIDAHNLELHDSPLLDSVYKRFSIETSILNDADAAAFAENRFGALKEAKNSMLVTIGTGIGVGIILNGRLFHGGRGRGVEAGHVQLDASGARCTCGRTGCIETLCSARWLERRALELAARRMDARAVIDAAKRGEPPFDTIWDDYIENLSNALASYVNILDPELIALGGGISGAGEFLTAPLARRVSELSFFREPTRIIAAKLGNDAGLLGAAFYNEKE